MTASRTGDGRGISGRAWQAAFVTAAVISACLLLLGDSSGGRALFHVGTLLPSAAILAGMWLHRPARGAHVWVLAAAAWGMGGVAQIVEVAAGLLPAAPAYLVAYLLGVIAYVRLIRLRSGGRDTAGLLDAGIFAGVACMLAWSWVVHPLIGRGIEADQAGLFVYPVLDLFLLFLFLRLILAPGRHTLSLHLLSLSIALTMMGDIGFMLDGPWPVLAALWVAAPGVAAVAALHPSMVAITEKVTVEVGDDLRRVRFNLLLLAGLVGPGSLALLAVTARTGPMPVAGVMSAGVFAVLLLRMRHAVHQRNAAQGATQRSLLRAQVLADTGALLAAAADEDSALRAAASGLSLLTGTTVAGDDLRRDRTAALAARDADPDLWAATDTILTSWSLRDQALSAMASARVNEERFRLLVQNAADGVAIVSETGAIIYSSPACQRIFGYAPDDVQGMEGFSFVYAEDMPAVLRLLEETIARPGERCSANARVVHADGALLMVELTVCNLLHEPSVAGLVVNVRDVTQRTSLEAELQQQAFHDALTGLANRSLLWEQLEQTLTRCTTRGGQAALILIDVDDFKDVNDTYGHDAGDAFLREVAVRLQASLRESDTAARLGGDEFAVLLEDISAPGDAVAAAERVLDAVARPFTFAGAPVGMSVSIGIAVTAGEDRSTEAWLQRADLAMYATKRRGDAAWTVHDESLQAEEVSRVRLRSELAVALEEDQLFCVYQPVVDLKTGRVLGVEALVRWMHPTRGLLPPADFIPAAEESGLITGLGTWVLDKTCAQLAAWRAEGAPDLLAHVNVAPAQLADPGFVGIVADTLARHGLDGRSIALEITETGLMESGQEMIARLTSLKALGVKLAIDDFGTGYSSLRYLQQFPVDILKIDRGFVSALDEGRESEAVARAIVQLAYVLDLDTVGEGVETVEQGDRLRELGCSQAQGYLFARPLTADEVRPHLSLSVVPAPPAAGRALAAHN